MGSILSEEIMDRFPALLTKGLNVKEINYRDTEKCVDLVIEFSLDMASASGLIHGSVLAAAMIMSSEIAASYAVKEGEYLIAVSTSLNFLRQPETIADLEITSCVSSRTDRVILVDVEARFSGTTVAKGSTLFIAEQMS